MKRRPPLPPPAPSVRLDYSEREPQRLNVEFLRNVAGFGDSLDKRLAGFVLELLELGEENPDEAARRLGATAALALNALRELEHARGKRKPSPRALLARIQTIANAVRDLDGDRARHPDVFRAAAGVLGPSWPILWSPAPDFASETESLALHLEHPTLSIRDKRGVRTFSAEEESSSRPGLRPLKTFRPSASWLALKLFENLTRVRSLNPARIGKAPPQWVSAARALPPFTSSAADGWAETAWGALLEDTDGRPEALWWKVVPASKRPVKRERPRSPSVPDFFTPSNVRAELRRLVLAAFKSLPRK